MEFLVGSILWIVANLAYLDDRRAGRRGFKRLVAFWLGWPWTFVTLLSVDEGSQPELRTDDEGLRELVREIRRDRRGRLAAPGPDPENQEEP